MTDSNSSTLITVAVIGGTGREGSGLALRLAQSGYRVIIGSRDAQKAELKAIELNSVLGSSYLRGKSNHDAAKEADLIILSVPYETHGEMVKGLYDALQGKILIDVTVPNQPPKLRTVFIPEGKSACLEAQAILGPNVKVVAAFQNVSYAHLQHPDEPISCDVLVCADDEPAKKDVIRLVTAIGLRGIDAGPLANAVAAEALTPVLLYINKKYNVKGGAGILITGVDIKPEES